jgi:hypothetical protein
MSATGVDSGTFVLSAYFLYSAGFLSSAGAGEAPGHEGDHGPMACTTAGGNAPPGGPPALVRQAGPQQRHDKYLLSIGAIRGTAARPVATWPVARARRAGWHQGSRHDWLLRHRRRDQEPAHPPGGTPPCPKLTTTAPYARCWSVSSGNRLCRWQEPASSGAATSPSLGGYCQPVTHERWPGSPVVVPLKGA